MLIRPESGPPHDCPAAASLPDWIELAGAVGLCARKLGAVVAPAAACHDLSASQLAVLAVCRQAPRDGLAQSRMAEVLGLSPATVSGIVEQLRARGLLEGRRSAADRRRQEWRLTDRGAALFRAVAAELAEPAARVQQHVGATALDAFRRLLDRLGAALDAAERPSTRVRRAG